MDLGCPGGCDGLCGVAIRAGREVSEARATGVLGEAKGVGGFGASLDELFGRFVGRDRRTGTLRRRGARHVWAVFSSPELCIFHTKIPTWGSRGLPNAIKM